MPADLNLARIADDVQRQSQAESLAEKVNERRRNLLKGAAAIAASSVLPGCGSGSGSGGDPSSSVDPPNVLFILVDELRFPSVFPAGVTSAAQFMQKFMPNTFTLWQKGVKFSN